MGGHCDVLTASNVRICKELLGYAFGLEFVFSIVKVVGPIKSLQK
jgi:hypothetical protein